MPTSNSVFNEKLDPSDIRSIRIQQRRDAAHELATVICESKPRYKDIQAQIEELESELEGLIEAEIDDIIFDDKSWASGQD